MENLKLVLRMRAGQWSPERLAAATGILDNAAKQIERLGAEDSTRGEKSSP